MASVQFVFHLNPWLRTLLIIVTTLTIYGALWGLEYLWNLLVAAPIALDTERDKAERDLREEGRNLKERLAAPRVSNLDQSKRELVGEQITEPEDRALLKRALEQGSVYVPRGGGAKAHSKLLMAGILQPGPGECSAVINPALSDAVHFYIFEKPDSTPTVPTAPKRDLRESPPSQE